MSLPPRDKVILWGRAAERCSFPSCRKRLVYDKTDVDGDVLLGEIAHIVAQKSDGPRGMKNPPGGKIDAYENTILLCKEHHTIIDGQPNTYPVEKLVQLKVDHEEWVKITPSPNEQYKGITSPPTVVSEKVYGTLLPVLDIPSFIYLAPCNIPEGDVRAIIQDPRTPNIMLPYIIRGDNLLSFCDLNDEEGPFRLAIDPYSAKKYHAEAWWDDPDKSRWYIELLNRSLNKLTGRKGLNLDKEHRRYYFEPEADGDERSIEYQSIGARKSSRKVAWRPHFRHNNELKNYWEHLAVGLRFHRIAQRSWCLSIRPERRFTRDGYQPLTSKGTGKRATNKKSRMYNFDVLNEVHFWRDYLSEGRIRIFFNFGKQQLVVGTELLFGDVAWPPITSDMKRRLKLTYEEDLFSWVEYNETANFEDEDGTDET